MGTCLACGSDLPPQDRPRNPRKWCSEACRVWALRHPGKERVRECSTCRAPLAPNRQRYCSLTCNNIGAGRVRAEPLADRDCAVCGTLFTPHGVNSKYCSKECRDRRPRKKVARKKRPYSDVDRDRDHRKRARKRGAATGEPVIRDEIAERDRFRCGICRKKVNMSLAWPHPKSPSLDHIEPLSLGGAHDPANVRLAHLDCNTRRSNAGGNEQLMLVG